jgi:hypothetical protein
MERVENIVSESQKSFSNIIQLVKEIQEDHRRDVKITSNLIII